MKLKCLIVDDEPLARKGMTEYVSEVDFLELCGQCRNATEAQQFLESNKVDLLLLDVQMPGQTGLEFLKSLSDPPLAIITSAFAEYALEGFELDVMDYLVKPIPFVRFLKAVTKAGDYYLLKHQKLKNEQEIFVKSSGKFERIKLNDILFVEAMQNYIIIHTDNKRLIVYKTLTSMEDELRRPSFIRVHKSFIAAIAKVNSIDGFDLVIGPNRIPVSRNVLAEVKQAVMGNHLLRH